MQNENAQVVSGRPSLADRFDLVGVVDQGFRLVRFHLKRLWRNSRLGAMSLRYFSGELLCAPRQVGAICPSSRTLARARAMAEGVDVDNDRLLIELGAGTGSVTQALLDRGVPVNRLIVIERSEVLVRRLRRRFPLVTVIQGDAAQLSALLGEQTHNICGVVSSLPLRSLNSATTGAIFAGILDILGNGGRLVQLSYDLRKPAVPERLGLHQISTRRVWANLPPARVDVFDYRPTEGANSSTEAQRVEICFEYPRVHYLIRFVSSTFPYRNFDTLGQALIIASCTYYLSRTTRKRQPG